MNRETAIVLSRNEALLWELTGQNGSALIIALVFLVVLTMLGIGVFYSATTEERIARNFRDQEIALRAAEAAIEEAKMLITGSYDRSTALANPPVVLDYKRCHPEGAIPGFSCRSDVYNSPFVDLYASGTPPGANLGTYDPRADRKTSPEIPGLAGQPRYLVVLLDDSLECGQNTEDAGLSCFRIYGQARGRVASTRVNLVELFRW
ncbi:pilus assembly PilX family protein [Propionivibrio soli]|uniref:pilus assembly PilX family protein n=1 Tax=Propionivibrio soli TaxID=2976531 RepID=UPI0021E8E173